MKYTLFTQTHIINHISYWPCTRCMTHFCGYHLHEFFLFHVMDIALYAKTYHKNISHLPNDSEYAGILTRGSGEADPNPGTIVGITKS
jgi:hypothetical protein